MTTAFLLGLMTRSFAYDFESGGLLYSIISADPPQVCLEGSVDSTAIQGELVIPDTVAFNDVDHAVTDIAPCAFWHCGQLTSLYVPASVTNIGYGSHPSMSSITIQCNPFVDTHLELITVDPDNPVYYSQGNSIVDVRTATLVVGCDNSTIPDGVVTIGTYAFAACLNQMPTIPPSVKTIGAGAFAECKDTTALVIPRSVDSICYLAFAYGRFTKVFIPNSVVTIEMEAFASNPMLRELVLSESVSYIKTNAFYGCNNLNKIYSLNSIPPAIGSGFSAAFPNFNQYLDLSIYVPIDAIEAYENAVGWNDFDHYQPIPFWEGSEWYYEIINDNGSVTYQHLEYVADTTIGNEHPKVIVRTNQIYDKESHTEVSHEYIKEEDGVVYWWNKQLQQFSVLYDFFAQEGDEWEIMVGTQSIRMTVDSVENRDYDGVLYKVLHVSDPNDLFSGDIICGIGHTTSFFPERLMKKPSKYKVNGFRCYWVDEALVLKMGEEDCDAVYQSFHDVDENPTSAFKVYPNPATTHLYVITNNVIPNNVITNPVLPNPSFLISTPLGQPILSGTLSNQTINVSTLPPGLYFLTIGNQTQKFCIAIQ